MLFSVTNQEIYNYVGTKGKPITVGFFSKNAEIGFDNDNQYWGLLFQVDDNPYVEGIMATSYYQGKYSGYGEIGY